MTRLEGVESARRYPVTRLVLPANAALDLSTKRGQVMTAIAKQGMQQRAEAAKAKPNGEGKPAVAETPARAAGTTSPPSHSKRACSACSGRTCASWTIGFACPAATGCCARRKRW